MRRSIAWSLAAIDHYGKSNLNNGTCRLLNFEHLPSLSTFNKKTRYVKTSFQENIQSDNPFDKA